MSGNRRLTLAAVFLPAVFSAVTFVLAPAAGADPGSPSYNQGKQAIDDQVYRHHVRMTADWFQDLDYCRQLLGNALKSGLMPRVDSPSDFIAGCQDEGRARATSH